MTDLLLQSPLSTNLAYELITVLLSIAVLILSLRLVWRAEKQLDKFFKVFGAAFFVIFIRQFLRVLISLDFIEAKSWMAVFDVFFGILIIWSLVIMNGIITRISKRE